MSFLCACGNRISTTQSPSRRDGAFSTEVDFESSLERGLRGAFELEDGPDESREERLQASVFDAYHDAARVVVFCGVCGRLYLQDAPASTTYTGYVPEAGT